MPFDLERFSHSRLADVPVAGDVTGLWALYRSAGETFDVLSVNAYNVWALVGRRPLVKSPGSGRVDWTPDSLDLPLAGGISAFVLGALLLGATGLVVAVPLLVRRGLADDPVVVLLGHVVLAAAFFSVPTRVHERYLFPVFVSGALLAVLATRWVISYAVASLTATVNLHAVLTGPVNPSFDVLGATPQQRPRAGTGAIAPRMPTELDQLSHAAGTWSRSLPVATAVSALHALFFVLLLGSWVALVGQRERAPAASLPRVVRWGRLPAERPPLDRSLLRSAPWSTRSIRHRSARSHRAQSTTTTRRTRTVSELADGRTIIYFDDSHGAPVRTALDSRPLGPQSTSGEIRYDALVDDWVAVAGHRGDRTFLPPKDECPLCPTGTGSAPSEVPDPAYDVVVFENRFPSLCGRIRPRRRRARALSVPAA